MKPDKSVSVFRDAVTLSALGKRRLFRALARAILSNSPDIDQEKQALHRDVATVEGHVRNQRARNGEDHDRNPR